MSESESPLKFHGVMCVEEEPLLFETSVAGPEAPYRPGEWRAELELWFGQSAGRTQLVRRRHVGPLAVQRPFHPEEDGTCHVYLLHPPGGVAEGDRLDMRFHIAPASRVLMTTPGATKFYRAEHGLSAQRTMIDVAAGGICEHLPQEIILFNGANASVDTQIRLLGDATYVGWDFFCLGRPAANERFERGQLRQRTEIVRDGRMIWFERMQIPVGSAVTEAAHALAGHPTWGTMVYAGPLTDNTAEQVRAAVGTDGDGVFSVSQLEHIIVCRYLGPRISHGKALFMRAWSALRIACQGKAASVPRIWAT